MRETSAGARGRLLLAVLVAAGVVAWWLLRSLGSVPPPPVAAARGVAAVPAAAIAPDVAAERHEVAPGSAAVYGRVTDASGVAVVGVVVEAEPQSLPEMRRWRGEWPSARTDRSGEFTFAGLPPGDYRVRLPSQRAIERLVTLAEGDRVRTDLQIDLGNCAITLVLRRHGDVVTSGRIMVEVGGETMFHVPADGAFHFVAPAGHHRLCICAAGATARSAPLRSGGALFVAELPLDVPAGRATLELALDVPVPSLEVTATDGSSMPFPVLRFTVRGTAAIGSTEATFEFAAADGHRGELAELPPGTWTVTASSPCLDAEPQQIDVPQGQAVHRLLITGRRAAIVRLDLRDLDGQPWRLERLGKVVLERLPPLRTATRELACDDIAPLLTPRPDGTALGFPGVPLGPAEWSTTDRTVDGVLHFLPFEPVPAPRLDVIGDGRDALMLCVQPRALVELIACEKGGRQSPQASVRVFLGDTPVAPYGDADRAVWSSCLPAAEYRVVIDYPDGRREHRIFVERQNLRLRLRR